MTSHEQIMLKALADILLCEPLPQAIADIAIKAIQAVCPRRDEHAQAPTLSPIVGVGQGK